MALCDVKIDKTLWKKISDTNLNVEYVEKFIPETIADDLLKTFESEFVYYTGALSTVKVFGKWHPIPRQQVAFGDEGLCYKFSGNTVPALPWTETMKQIQSFLNNATGHYYNFVLVNKYRNGSDCIGEHKDDESELEINTPIASLSFGQTRDFVLKYRPKGFTNKRKSHKLPLSHGDLVLLHSPTNSYWTHCVPRRGNAPGVRINLTFRKLNQTDKEVTIRKSLKTTSKYFDDSEKDEKKNKKLKKSD